MSLTFQRKTELISQLADPDRWHSHFSADWLMDETRRWRIKEYGSLTARFNKDGNVARISHQNGAFLNIERLGPKTIVSDEAGTIVVAHGKLVAVKEGPEPRFIKPWQFLDKPKTNDLALDHIALPEVGAQIFFDNEARTKTIQLEDHDGVQVTFHQATDLEQPERRLHRTRLLHSVAFEAPDDSPIGFYDLFNAALLVTAFDLGLEPDLKATNEVAPDKMIQYLKLRAKYEEQGTEFSSGAVDWRGIGSDFEMPSFEDLQIPWDDTTEFQGSVLGSPQRFMVEKEESGFSISTSMDQREQIFSYGVLLERVLHEGQRKAKKYNPARGTPGNILQLVEGGTKTENHRGCEWRYIVIGSTKAAVTANHIRTVMQRNFGLSGGDYAVISFDDGLTMAAMNLAKLDAAIEQQEATRGMMQGLETGEIGDETPESFVRKHFKRGADLRCFEPDTAESGEGFMKVATRNEQYELAAAIRNYRGEGPIAEAS